MEQHETDEKFMRLALNEAQKALKQQEVPIGAVVVAGGAVIGRGHNLVETLADPTAHARACNIRETQQDPAGHAEFVAMKAAAAELGVWRLTGCTVYVTLEPCIMCAGAIGWAQVSRVVWGADDPKRGYTTVEGLRLHPRTVVVRGVLAAECEALMKEFFKELR